MDTKEGGGRKDAPGQSSAGHAMLTGRGEEGGGGKLSGPVYCTMVPAMFIFGKLLLHIFYLLTFSQVNISGPTMLPPISCPGRRREGWAYHADRFETGYCAQAMIIFHLIKFSFFSILDVPFITQTYRCCLCLV